VGAQDDQHEQMRAIGEQMSRTLSRTTEIARRALLPETQTFFAEQQEALNRSTRALIGADLAKHLRTQERFILRVTFPQRAHAELADSSNERSRRQPSRPSRSHR
jgi:hypothetical protein